MKRGSSNGQPPSDVLATKPNLRRVLTGRRCINLGLKIRGILKEMVERNLTIEFALLYKCLHIENECSMIVEILSNQWVSGEYYQMEFECPDLTDPISPGQFFMLRVREGTEPYLRRPFSFFDARWEKGKSIFELLYKVVGMGTRLIAGLKKGEKVDIIAPLGKGFWIPSDIRVAIIVAGGIGLAPLLFLARRIGQERKEVRIVFLYGAYGKTDLINIDQIKEASSELRVCTEDGSLGSKMLVTELLERYLEGNGSGNRFINIFSCGPRDMLKAVSAIAKKHGTPCQVSLESSMACGFGACLGCVVKVSLGQNNRIGYERVCSEGPVFDSERILWDE